MEDSGMGDESMGWLGCGSWWCSWWCSIVLVDADTVAGLEMLELCGEVVAAAVVAWW